nr:uncharacterized mitochondrial protein AtMg00810-like [Tanacetum cinerariifolium]
MCDEKNSVLFTNTECLVLSPNFKLPDESQVLLRVPRENNMYNVNLKNIVPSGDLTCLFAKATINESNLWHRRLGHINFKTMNKLVKNRFLVSKPHSKFDGNVDEGFLVGYSISSKAFRVFNSRTRIVQKTLHVNFLENKPNVAGSGPAWLFNIDTLTKTVNYQPVTICNQSNPSVGFKDTFDAEKVGEEIDQQYVLFPVLSSGFTNPQNTNGDTVFDEKEHEFDEKKHESEVNVSPSSSAQSKKQDDNTKREAKGKNHVDSFTGNIDLSAEFEDLSDNIINEVNAAELEDITYSDDEDDVGAEADFNNLKTSIAVSPIPTTRVHKDHLVTQIIIDLSLATQTRSMERVAKDQEPKWVHQALKIQVGLKLCRKRFFNSRCKSRFTWVFFLATKDETSPILKTFITGLENQLSLKVKVIRSDNGTKFKNNDLNQFCRIKRIKREFSVPRTPQQNGIAERKNMTLIEAARTMLADSLIPILFWTEAVNTACYVQNRVLVTKPHNKTPYELLHGRTPSISFMRPFGCHVTILNTLDSLGKFDGKVDKGFLVGYSVSSKSFRVFNSRTRIVQETFWKTSLMLQVVVLHGCLILIVLQRLRIINQSLHAINLTIVQNTNGDVAFDGKELEFDVKKPESEVNVSPGSSAQLKKQDDKTKREAKGKSPVESLTGYKDLSVEFEDYSEDSINEVNAAGTLVPTVGQISLNSTNTFSAASLSNANWKKLPILMMKMMLVHRLTSEEPKRVHQNLKDLSWIEAMQEELLQFKMQKVWILVDLPHGKRAIGFEEPDHPDKVYKVVKALYGLHQAPRAWYETLANYLLENGFQKGKIDQTLFIKRQKGDILLLQIYVDDIIFGSTNKDLYKAFEKLMKDKFHMSSMGELTFFLGLQVKQKRDGIFISQDKYVAEILRKFGLTDGKSASTPIDTEKPLLKDLDGEDVDVHTYISMIGSLMYLTSSRPNIMFVVCACACFQVTPKASHLHAVKRIVRYLKGKPHLGLWYPKDSPFDLLAYSDSDYDGTSLDRKSTTGGCQFLGCNLISWQCKKQTVVATSSTEAEYVAAASCCAQVLWIQNQLLNYNEGFNQIIDFLHGSSIEYALTMNPNIYVSCIKQFWTTVAVKKVNDVIRLQALVDKKKVVVTEATIREVLRLDDAEGVKCLPNEEIFAELARMGYEKPSN